MQVGASWEDLAPLDLSATVSVSAIAACNLHVRLTDIHLTGHKNMVINWSSLKLFENVLLDFRFDRF